MRRKSAVLQYRYHSDTKSSMTYTYDILQSVPLKDISVRSVLHINTKFARRIHEFSLVEEVS